MDTLNTISELRAAISSARRQGKKIAFVPTMGNLHAGHISLVHEAHNHGDLVVASIFVNPMQFGANEDLDSYPRTLTADLEKLAAAGTHLVFAPNAKEIYPQGLGSQTVVSTPNFASKLCGKSRPVFFDGIATVVSKLFNMVQPDTAIFGEKDFQQLMVIRQMVNDLNLPINIVGVATAREANGLAMSSRNGYLDDAQKTQASALYQEMLSVKAKIVAGNNDYEILCIDAKRNLNQQGFNVDYFEVCNGQTLESASPNDAVKVIITAVVLNKTRLIDNLVI